MLVGVIAEELLLPEGGRFADLYVDNDLFPLATIRVPGYLLLEGPFDEGDVFYTSYVGNVSLSIYPPAIIDNDVFYNFTKANIVTLAASLVQDVDAFYGPKVLDKVLGPALFVDDDLFGGVKKLTQGKATINQTVPIANVVDSDIFYGSVVERSGIVIITQQAAVATDFDAVYLSETTASAISLLGSFVKETASYTPPPLGHLVPSLFAGDDTFFIPNVQGPLSSSLFVDADVFYAPARVNYVTPSAVLASDVIFAPSAVRQLLPGAVADGDNIRGPAFTQPGAFGLVIDVEFFSAPTIAAQAAYLGPALLNDAAIDAIYASRVDAAIIAPYDSALGADVFFAPAATRAALTPVVSVVDPDIFFVPGVGSGPLLVGFVTDADTFYAPGIPVALAPTRISDSDTFFAPAVAPALVSDLFTDADNFFAPLAHTIDAMAPAVVADADAVLAPTVVPGAVTAAPIFIGADDAFFVPTTTSSVTLAAPLVVDSDTVLAPNTSTVSLPSAFTDADAFFVPVIMQTGFDGTLALDGPIMPSTPQPTVILVEG